MAFVHASEFVNNYVSNLSIVDKVSSLITQKEDPSISMGRLLSAKSLRQLQSKPKPQSMRSLENSTTELPSVNLKSQKKIKKSSKSYLSTRSIKTSTSRYTKNPSLAPRNCKKRIPIKDDQARVGCNNEDKDNTTNQNLKSPDNEFQYDGKNDEQDFSEILFME